MTPLAKLPPSRLAKALRANVAIKPINPIDEGRGFQRLLEAGWRLPRIARETGNDLRAVQHGLAFLKFPRDIQGWIASGKLSPRGARELICYVSPKGQIGRNAPKNFVARPQLARELARFSLKTGISLERIKLNLHAA